MENILIVGIGGFIGANVRYLISTWAAANSPTAFPLGTLFINISGSILLAVFLGWLGNHSTIDPHVRLLVAVGFFGAYTTFSSYAVESIERLQAGQWLHFAVNVIGSNIACLAGALIGLWIGNRLP